MIEKSILAFSEKKIPPDILPGTFFPLPDGLDLVLFRTSRVVAIYHNNELLEMCHLSHAEFSAMLIFYEQYPFFTPDESFQLFGGKWVLAPLRGKLSSLSLNIKRMRETGYYIGLVADVPSTTGKEAVTA